MNNNSSEKEELRARQLRIIAGTILALRDHVALSWWCWVEPPGRGHVTLLPLAMLPNVSDRRSCESRELGDKIRSTLFGKQTSIHFYLDAAHQLWLPSWALHGRGPLRLSPVICTTRLRIVPKHVRARFPDLAEQRGISLALDNLDTDFLGELGEPDPKTTEEVVDFTLRIAEYLRADAKINSAFAQGPPGSAFSCDVQHGSGPSSRYFVCGRIWPPPSNYFSEDVLNISHRPERQASSEVTPETERP